jgi:predicted PurR-regulated permease PerM
MKWVFLVLFLLFVFYIREVFPPFIAGAIVAYLLFPLVSWVVELNRYPALKWLNKRFAILIIYVTVATILGVIAYSFGPRLVAELTNLIENRQEIASNVVKQTASALHLGLDVDRSTAQLLKAVESVSGKPSELFHLGGLLSHELLALLECVVTSIYLLVDYRSVGRFLLRFIPANQHVAIANIVGHLNRMLSKYIGGQLILMAVMSAAAFVFLSIFKIKYALVLALVSGVFEIIPVIGPVIAIALAVIVGVSQFGPPIIPWIVGCYWLARQLEDYYVVPLVIGKAVELHPLSIIFAVVVGERVGGALGMLVAIPAAASIKVVLDSYFPAPRPFEVM